MQGSFIVYMIGYILIIAGVWYGLDSAGAPAPWPTVAVLILGGLGVIYAFSRSQRDKAMDPEKNAQADRMRQQDGGAQQGGQSQQDGGQT